MMAIARSAVKSAPPFPATTGSGAAPPTTNATTTGPSGPVPPSATTVAASDDATLVDRNVVIVSVVAIGIVYTIVYLVSRFYWDTDPLSASLPLESLGAFALFYVAAQAVERLLEPFSKLSGTKAELVRDLQKAAATFATFPGDKTLGEAAAKAQAALNAERANRTVYLWAAATALGIIASGWLQLYFLHAVGVTAAPRSAEILATGLIIGAGTKPLHDLIARLEKAKNKAADPAETGGN